MDGDSLKPDHPVYDGWGPRGERLACASEGGLGREVAHGGEEEGDGERGAWGSPFYSRFTVGCV